MSVIKNKRLLLFSVIVAILLSVAVFESLGVTAFALSEEEAGESYDKQRYKTDGTPLAEDEMYYFRYLYLKDNLPCGSIAAFAYEMAATIDGTHPELSAMAIAKGSVRLGMFKSADGTPLLEGGSSILSLAYDVVKPVGMALLLLFFLIEVLSDSTSDNFNTEHLMKKLISLAICAIVIIEGPNILGVLVQFGDQMLEVAEDAIAAASASGGLAKEVWIDLVMEDDGGLFSFFFVLGRAIGSIFGNLIYWILTMAAIVVICFTAFGRVLELSVRYIFAPLGLASIISGNAPARSAGMRYLKQFASLCLQGAVIVAAVGAAGIIKASIDADESFIMGTFAFILIPLTLIGFITRSGRVTDDIIGVHGNSL